jgi:hypothetical protein
MKRLDDTKSIDELKHLLVALEKKRWCTLH